MGRAVLFGERKVTPHAKVPGNMLTHRQAEVLLFMWDFYERNDQPPPCEVISDHFKFASTNSAQSHIDALARKGWLERNAVTTATARAICLGTPCAALSGPAAIPPFRSGTACRQSSRWSRKCKR